MVLAKSSRKGKKAWRKNIDTTEVVDSLAQQTEEERQGTAVSHLPDDELFYVDKAGEEQGSQEAPQGSGGAALQKRRKRQQPGLLRSQVILQAAHQARPVRDGMPAFKKAAVKKLQHGTGAAAVTDGQGRGSGQLANGAGAVLDIWGDEEVAPRVKRKKLPGSCSQRPLIAAVEVDQGGCSFNPDPEQHQDALGEAVAAELGKKLSQQLARTPPPRNVDYIPQTDELALLVVDAEADDDDEGTGQDGRQEATLQVQGGGGGTEQGDNGGELGAADDSASPGGVPASALQRKKTKKDRARNKRRRKAEREEAARKALKRQRRDIEELGSLKAQVEEECVVQEAKRRRKMAIRLERAASQPPRLGPHPFTPEPVQLLLTEEVSGSLRRIKAAPTLLRDRYKSLQKRGVVEARVPLKAKVGKRVEFVAGSRAERALQEQQQLDAVVKNRKKKMKSMKSSV